MPKAKRATAPAPASAPAPAPAAHKQATAAEASHSESGTDDMASDLDLAAAEAALPATMSKEERRKYINRMAARRSRRKKAAMQHELEQAVAQAQERLDQLANEKRSLLMEIAQLERLVGAHDRAPCKVNSRP